jgi:hypothetical protein
LVCGGVHGDGDEWGCGGLHGDALGFGGLHGDEMDFEDLCDGGEIENERDAGYDGVVLKNGSDVLMRGYFVGYCCNRCGC